MRLLAVPLRRPATCRWQRGKAAVGSNAELRSPIPCCHFLVDHVRQAIFVRTTKIGEGF